VATPLTPDQLRDLIRATLDNYLDQVGDDIATSIERAPEPCGHRTCAGGGACGYVVAALMDESVRCECRVGCGTASEVARLRAELDRARDLTDSAAEYRVLIPDHGGTELRLRRGSAPHAPGWSVAVPAAGGGVALTQLGWADSISTLAVDQLYCWPTPGAAIEAARDALPR
jgi:hypothetical protein